MTQESLTEKLAKHLMRPVDDATRARARLHLLDWLGCVAGARESVTAQGYARMQTETHIWLGNVLEMDDVHRTAILHPGPIVWPASLNYEGGLDVCLDASVRGYEAMICVGATFDAHHYGFFHPTATAGTFGAVVADLASLGSFSEEAPSTIADALGLAGTATGGLWQTRHEGDDAKQFHIFQAVNRGHEAASAALFGAKGPHHILEGPQGLYAATCKEPKPMQFPKQWRIHEVSFKPWGACRHAHPVIDAALELKMKLGSLDGEILVETYADSITFCDRLDPTTPAEAKFSLQHAVAVVAAKGEPELADFEPDAIAKFADIRSRVKIAEGPDITARYPEHYGARVSCGGESVELVDTLGDPERPMSKQQIVGKARALIAWGGLPDKEADRAVDLALHGDDAGAIDKMLGDWLS